MPKSQALSIESRLAQPATHPWLFYLLAPGPIIRLASSGYKALVNLEAASNVVAKLSLFLPFPFPFSR
jgi:hypothetical protein